MPSLGGFIGYTSASFGILQVAVSQSTTELIVCNWARARASKFSLCIPCFVPTRLTFHPYVYFCSEYWFCGDRTLSSTTILNQDWKLKFLTRSVTHELPGIESRTSETTLRLSSNDQSSPFRSSSFIDQSNSSTI